MRKIPIESHLPKHFTLTINQLNPSFLTENFKLLQNYPETGTFFGYFHRYHSNVTKTRVIFWWEVQHIQTNDQHGTSNACAHDAKLAPLFITSAENIGTRAIHQITDHFTCTSANVILRICITWFTSKGYSLADRKQEDDLATDSEKTFVTEKGILI